MRSISSFFVIALFVLISFDALSPIHATPEELRATEESAVKSQKVIAVLGSSVASGWVTSYKEKYDMQNGYAARLGRLLSERGYKVENVSVPGDDTKKVLARMERDLYPLKPRFVIIGLSLGNEGIEEEDHEKVMTHFQDGVEQIAGQCRAQGIIPVLGSCYACNSYEEAHYQCTKTVNLLENAWGMPVINLLGAVDDGSGHFPAGYAYDPGHPDNRGHEEMFYAIVPGLFDAIEQGKPLPVMPEDPGFVTVKGGGGELPLCFIPDEVVHSFAMVFSVRTGCTGTIASISFPDNGACLEIDKAGRLLYSAAGDEQVRSSEKILDNAWHQIAISHRFLKGETLVFLDGKCLGACSGQLEPIRFCLGTGERSPVESADFRDWMVYRSSLNNEEIEALHAGKLLHASLEVFAPLRNEALTKNRLVENRAQSTSKVMTYPANQEKAIEAIRRKIEKSALVRKQEPLFEEKQPVKLDPAIYDAYVGSYRLAPGVDFEVTRDGDKLIFEDPMGGKGEIYPESKTRFFIKFPLAELTVTFIMGDSEKITHLVFSMNGQEEKAKKVD